MMEYATQDYEDQEADQAPEPEDQFMMMDEGDQDEDQEDEDEIDYEQEAYAYQQQLIQEQRTVLLQKQQRQQRILLKKGQNSGGQGVKLKPQPLLRNGGTGNGSLLKITRTSPKHGVAMNLTQGGVGITSGSMSSEGQRQRQRLGQHQGQSVINGGGGRVQQGSKATSSLTMNGRKMAYYQQPQGGRSVKNKNGGGGGHGGRATVAGEMFSVGGTYSDQDEDQSMEEQDGNYYQNQNGEEYQDQEGVADYEDYDGQGQGSEYYEDGEDEGEEEYPDTLQFCEAQFDDDAEDNNDEEARGLPPLPMQGNYGNSDNYTEGSSRITTNEAGIRIVESSSVYEPQGEELDYEQYQYVDQSQLMPTKKVQMNKPRKARPEKMAADAYLRQLQSDDYDNFKPNILARKLMGVPSQIVQATRPPPLLHKSLQQNSGNKSSSSNSNSNSSSPTNNTSALNTSTSTISLESILRQQRPSNNSMPRLQPKTAGGLVLGNQLKIKPNHIIPTVSVSDMIHSSRSKAERQIAQFQKLQMAPQQTKSKFMNQQPISRSILNSPNKRPRPSNYQGPADNEICNSSSARTNGLSSAQSSFFNSGTSNNRLSIVNVEQGQKNALRLTQTPPKPQKNVPRCLVCNRTFATNQVLQRHMGLHNNGPSTTTSGAETETRKYKCDECFESFTSPTLLNQHITQSHDSNSTGIDFSMNSNSNSSSPIHRCRVCYRTFTCLESLKAHSLMHDGEFKCRACRRGFADWNTLEEHEATHKRYNCQWCEKYFMNSGNLKAHERIHTGERPYKCQDCPKAFKQLGGLQYHLKTNPNHKPQKYHKNEMMEGSDGNEDGFNGYQYANYEEYDDGDGDDVVLNMSLSDIAAANGL